MRLGVKGLPLQLARQLLGQSHRERSRVSSVRLARHPTKAPMIAQRLLVGCDAFREYYGGAWSENQDRSPSARQSVRKSSPAATSPPIPNPAASLPAAGK